MLPPRSNLRRIPSLLRPLRPPRTIPRPSTSTSSSTSIIQHRPFTHNTQLLLLLSSPTVRPQLPFLHAPSPLKPDRNPSLLTPQTLTRLISTERRAYYRRTITGGLKLGLTFYALLLLFYLIQLGVYQEKIERMYPTPSEWGLKRRWCLRSARALQDPERFGKLGTSWPRVGGYVRDLVEGLEREEGVRDVEEGGLLVEGVGRMGLDVSGKSEEWRRGYFEALMSGAKAAENMDGWLKDEVLKVACPPEYVLSEENPNPKTPPRGMKVKTKGGEVPRMENCSKAYESPEVFYMKILTTVGFGTREKIDAALGYADWLDFKGLAGTAREMYSWAMDIAVEGMGAEQQEGNDKQVDVSKLVDMKSGVLKGDSQAKDVVSENLMRVSTALAVHHARIGELPTALSIFLSVLRARRELDSSTPPPTSSPTSPKKPSPSSLTGTLSSLFSPTTYPPPLSSGNQPPPTTSPCDEAALMTYIGEILFASSSHETGLAWTRDAVDIAESTIVQLADHDEEGSTGGGESQKCRECLQTSLSNWKTMIRTLVRDAENEELDAIQHPSHTTSTSSSKLSFWSKTAQNDQLIQEKATARRRWEAEGMILEERTRRLRGYLGGVDATGTAGGGASGLFGFVPEGGVFFK